MNSLDIMTFKSPTLINKLSPRQGVGMDYKNFDSVKK